MRRRSIAGPLILVILGGLFLWRNLHPEAPIFDLLSEYWPFLLIAWGAVRLLEIVVSRQTRYPGLTGGEVVLIVLICVAGLGLFEVHSRGFRVAPEIFGEQFDYPISADQAASGTTRIVFDNPNGNIKVTGGDSGQVSITGHKLIRAYRQTDADRTNQGTPLEIIPQGDRLLVRSNQGRAPEGQRISDDLEVTVPRGVAVEVQGRSGDYEISNVAGDVVLTSARSDVRLTQVGGNARLDIGRSSLIRAQNVKGNIDLDGRGSDIDLENIGGQVTINGAYLGSLDFKNLAKPLRFDGARNTEVRAEAVPGSISMDLGELTAKNLVGPVRLVTRSRDVHLEDFTQSLELETERGDIELQPGHVPLPKIEAHSRTGRIDLILPDKANFQLQATAQRGEVVNDFGPPLRTEAEGRGAILRGGSGEGPMIRVTADRGIVSVRKQGAAPKQAPAGSDTEVKL